jgi:hypothetical protein
MALDDRCRAPVLVCCNIFQPTSCRHAARVCTGGVVYSPPYIMRCMTGVRFLCMDVLRCHGIFSRTIFKVKTSILRLVLDWRQSFLRFPVMISRAGGSNGKSVPWISPPRDCHGYPVTSVWLSRVLPQDPHSDQEVRSCSTYIHKISRVWSSYPAVQGLNRCDRKDINEPGIL